MDGLYGAPLEEFTAQRNELAKELRRSGERDTAEEVGRLRKPTAAAWAINQLSHREEPALRSVLDAGRQLRKAQESALGGGSGAALRKAGAAEREAVTAAAAEATAHPRREGRARRPWSRSATPCTRLPVMTTCAPRSRRAG